MTYVSFGKLFSLNNRIAVIKVNPDSSHIERFQKIISFTKLLNMAKQIPLILHQAFESFRLAENEMNRPGEDVVAFCACQNMRNSINIFLLTYLASKSVQVEGEKKFNDLLTYAKKLDPQFKAINLSCFECKNNGSGKGASHYCLSPDKVNECFVQTKMVKNLVLSKMEISEKDVALT